MTSKAAVGANRAKLDRVPRTLGPAGTLKSTDIKPDTVGSRCPPPNRFLVRIELQAPEKIVSLFVIEVVEDGGRVLDGTYCTMRLVTNPLE
jgi:hypothetical protein